MHLLKFLKVITGNVLVASSSFPDAFVEPMLCIRLPICSLPICSTDPSFAEEKK